MLIEIKLPRSSRIIAYAPPENYLAYGYRVVCAPSGERMAAMTITILGENSRTYCVSLTDEDIKAIYEARGSIYTHRVEDHAWLKL